jgi:4-hydroxymandelate oxidase
MQESNIRLTSRRQFLRFLASSPLYASVGTALAEGLDVPMRLPDPMAWAPRDLGHPIADPRQAINIFDFETVARQRVPPAHFGYMAAGVDDDLTLRANREGFLKFQLRPRRLIDVSKVDMSVDILGVRYDTPIVLAPTSSHKAFHPDGEIAVAKGARSGNHLQILSTLTTTRIEDVIAARGQPIWFQLYASNNWETAKALVKRAENAGCLAVVVTVDVHGSRVQETQLRLARTDTRECAACHDRSSRTAQNRRRTMYEGIDLTSPGNGPATAMTWEFFQRLRDTTKMKILVKGLVAHEDARLAADAGLDAIVVSNHGGRAEESGRATIDTLPEIVEAVAGRMPILIDSGFRRGTDIAKALCIGATAVCVGRPYLWGLGAFGEPGVARVLELLRLELRTAMQQLGAPTVKHLVPAMVRRA